MKILTAEEMRNIDRETIEKYGVTGTDLMERAGLAVAQKIKETFGKGRVIVLSGRGNNGGDGFVVARNLLNNGWDVQVFLAARPEDLKGDAFIQYKNISQNGIKIKQIQDFLEHHPSIITRDSILVDALFGTGLSKNITGVIADVIDIINSSEIPVFSVDIPSGISSDNGQIIGKAVKANYTVTFGLPKRGHYLYPGAEYSGKVFVENIGFPERLLNSEKLSVELIDKKTVYRLIPERREYSHKGNYGHVLVVAGSKGKTGAALLAARGCLKSGAGLVTVGVPESLSGIFQSRVTEEMTLMLPDKGNGTLSRKASSKIFCFLKNKADILAIGPGIGVSPETTYIMKSIIKNAGCPIIIDADGINSIKGKKGILSGSNVPIILTPHPGEMARLLEDRKSGKTRTKKGVFIGKSDKEILTSIEKDKINTALSFSAETKTHLVLKGVPTVVATPDGKAFVNSTGNPGMAKAGTGDVLTGMIAGFLCQTNDPVASCILGVFMHGMAGDIAESEKGLHSMVATDIIEKIPAAFLTLSENG